MKVKWLKVYDLSENDELIAKVQDATLNTKDFGLVPEIALYGTEEWWEAISSGLIETYQIEGVITDVFSSGDSNWPQFEVDDSRERTIWTRFGKQDLYAVGRRVKVEYVQQKPKKSWTGSPFQNEILKISVEL